jgi:F0F1-type ATP synthase membrane subunit c/vacuolar-type H+-ATPase subunit K
LTGALSSLLSLAVPLFSGALGQLNLSFPFVAASVLGFSGLVASRLLMRESRTSLTRTGGYLSTMKTAARTMAQSRTLLLVTSALAVSSIAYPYGNLFWQPALKQLGSGILCLGVVGSLMALAYTVSSYVSGLGRKPKMKSLVGLLLASIAPILATSSPFVIQLTLVFMVFRAGVGFV